MSGLSGKGKNPATVPYGNGEIIWLTKMKMLIKLTTLASCMFPSGQAFDAQKLRSDFRQVLRSRRVREVPLRVEFAKPAAKPLCQDTTQPSTEAGLESRPKANISNIEDSLKEERLYLTTEGGEQGRLPVLILSLKGNKHQRRHAIVFLHGTGSSKESFCPLLKAYASRGYVAVAIDSRYHGERAHSPTAYQDALISAWKTGKTMPFIYDTVWDLIKLADYLTQREDIDISRIGITGISLGGMHAWFAAFADTRYAVVVPMIGVQGFQWAIDNDKWQARVDSIKPVFEVACEDLGKSAIDKEVVKKVWDRIAPGLASKFDSPYTIPAIAPRPLLILNGAEDPRCPIGGLKIPESNARQAYGEFHRLTNFKALVSAWKTGETMPFIYDTVWDLIKLADYLTQREDIDPSRTGITGISLGGMHAWFATFADTRYAVVAPLIGVQGFRWAVDNDKWHARVDSIRPMFQAACDDLGKSAIDKEVVQKVWDRIAPGLASKFDSPYSIPAIALRPLLILNGAEDPRTPLEGLEVPISNAQRAYQESHCPDNFKMIAEPGIGHLATPYMIKKASVWFDRFLRPSLCPQISASTPD